MSTFPTDWQYKRSIAIDSGQKSGSPTGIVLTITHDSGIADANGPLDADGTAPSQNGGGDIRCSSDAAGSTQIPVDVVSWVTDNDHASATCEIKVNFDDLSSDTLYLWWKTTATDSQPAVTDTYGRNAVYSSGNHEAVWAMDEDPSGSAPQITDRTGNGCNGTSSGSMTSGDVVTGQVGDALDFDGTDDALTIATASNPLAGHTDVSFSVWLNIDAAHTGGLNRTVSCGVDDDFDLGANWSGSTLAGVANGHMGWYIRNTGGWFDIGALSARGNWDLVTVTANASGLKGYINGTQTYTSGTALTNGVDGEMVFSRRYSSGFLTKEKLSESRAYSRVLSGDDVATQYNCESDNAVFWSVGSVTAVGGGGPTPYYNNFLHAQIGAC